MGEQIKSRVSIKLFLGTLLTAELKAMLSQNPEWQTNKLVSERETLAVVRYQDKEYIGISINEDQISMKELSRLENLLRATLQGYCKDYDIDSLKFYVLPRIFIS